MSDGRLGVRGGSTASLAEGMNLIDANKAVEAERVKLAIMRHAWAAGEFHADDAADWQVSEPNIIGAQVNALARGGLIEKLNRHGAAEHRKGAAKAAHGRASYVWRLTERGRERALSHARAESRRAASELAHETGEAPHEAAAALFDVERPRGYGDPEMD